MTSVSMPKKEQILFSARKLFVSKGYKGTSIRDIASHADVQISLIYHYYENKISLWHSVKNSYQVDYENDHLLHHVPDTENIYDFFREIIESRFHFFKTNYDYLRISDWHKLEDIKEKMICIHTNKKNTIYSCLEKK